MLATTMLYVQIKLVGKNPPETIIFIIISTKFKGEITLIRMWREHKSKCQTSKIHDLMLKLEQLMSVKVIGTISVQHSVRICETFSNPLQDISAQACLCAAAIVHVEELVDNPDPSSH